MKSFLPTRIGLLLALIISSSWVNVVEGYRRPFMKRTEVNGSVLNKKQASDITVRAGDNTVSKKALSRQVAVLSSLVLAFNSGYINGCCLGGAIAPDGTKQAVSAVTGAWTTSALGAASGKTSSFSTPFGMILSYAFGSTLASLLNPYPQAFQISEGSCAASFLIGSALLFGANSLASKGTSSSKFYFNLAAIANGLQNSVTSVHTANLCRTAHFSGITSDIGTFFGQVLRGNMENLFKLKVFVALAAAFWLGGFTSFSITPKMASESLMISAIFYLAIGTGLLWSHITTPKKVAA